MSSLVHLRTISLIRALENEIQKLHNQMDEEEGFSPMQVQTGYKLKALNDQLQRLKKFNKNMQSLKQSAKRSS